MVITENMILSFYLLQNYLVDISFLGSAVMAGVHSRQHMVKYMVNLILMLDDS